MLVWPSIPPTHLETSCLRARLARVKRRRVSPTARPESPVSSNGVHADRTMSSVKKITAPWSVSLVQP